MEIAKFDEGVLIIDDREQGERLLTKRAKNPAWVAKLGQKYRQPKAEKSVLELNNLPFVQGRTGRFRYNKSSY